MKLSRPSLLLGLALALAACGQQSVTPSAQPSTDASALSTQSAQKDRFLVGFKRGAGVDRAAVTRAGGTVTQEWKELDAAAVRIPAQAVDALRRNPNVEYVEEDVVRHALGQRHVVSDLAAANGKPAPAPAPAPGAASTSPPPVRTPRGETTWGDSALQVPTLRSAGRTGAGVAVCVGDTGIDANHPEFAGKLKGFRNFMGDGRDVATQLNDVSHHGTHVSGTIFAQWGAGTGATGLQSGMDANGVGGVASGVNLYMARVLGDDGSGSSSGIINGVNWCASLPEQHVVISLSLGSSAGSRTEQRAYDNAYAKGVLIVAASGNDGGPIGYPANYSSVVAVGAIDDHGGLASFSNFGANQELVGPGVAVLSSVPLGQGLAAKASAVNVTAYSSVLAADFAGQGSATNLPIVAAGGTNNELCGVGTTNAALRGAIALISRGTCSFEEKVNNAVASGAKAVIIYNNTAGDLGMTLNTQKSIPVVGITQQDGQNTLAKLPTTGSVSITPADYEYFDGTSMATPHVSAAAAVVWAAKPSLTNAQLRTLLQNTARDFGTLGRDSSFGYGLVDPVKAINN
ncbi:S8 family serine peptidase [Deinococcus pimensis]|uniref:S8 family serine peptidase n=1 Tax=Deinococcus pimensis TaxID=309888 RepID=UPI0004894B49|nr:S8 family serine peptidase [Deinococcus pimensis]